LEVAVASSWWCVWGSKPGSAVVRARLRPTWSTAVATSSRRRCAGASMGCGTSTPAAPPPDARTDMPPAAKYTAPTPATAAAVLAAAESAPETSAREAAARPLKAIFDAIDTDGSGSVSQAELRKKLAADNEIQTLLTAAGGDGNNYVWEQLDDDGNGSITWAEFEAMLSPDVGGFVGELGPPPQVTEDKPVDLKALFASIDVDGNGAISQAELRKKLSQDDQVQRVLEKMGGDGKSQVFVQLDEDGDGKITWEEFEAMLSEDGGAFMDLMVEGNAAP